ncbi:MAG TPA: hypothetical protein PLS29_07275, partial [Acidimicrobiales bacterium]|nr:hypothetical protein [Acidimicrobiales bacterium]
MPTLQFLLKLAGSVGKRHANVPRRITAGSIERVGRRRVGGVVVVVGGVVVVVGGVVVVVGGVVVVVVVGLVVVVPDPFVGSVVVVVVVVVVDVVVVGGVVVGPAGTKFTGR